MATSFLRRRTLLVLPAVLLTVALIEDVAAFKIRQHVHNAYLRNVIVLVLYGAAFTVAADWISPWLRRLLLTARRDSRRAGGPIGLLLFYAVAYGALYYAYLVEDARGPGALLPLSIG